MTARFFRRFTLPVAVLLWSVGAATASTTITWVSDPVRPDETVLVLGGKFTRDVVGEIARLDDGPAGSPGTAGVPAVAHWTQVPPLQVSDHSVKFVVPKDWRLGTYACRIRTGNETSNTVIANAPDPWWLQGDRGETATPGGWLRIFGKCLSQGAPVTVALQPANGPASLLRPKAVDDYALAIDLPANLPPGGYTVFVHNGCGGSTTWRRAGEVSMVRPKPWKTDIFNVKDFGADSDKAIRSALAKAEANGGGVVYFPRGRYLVKGELDLPPYTVLKGEGMGLVSLYWPDMDTPPDQLVKGTDFGIEDLSLYCQNHKNVITDTDQSDRVFLHRVRIRANCYFMIEDIGKAFRGRTGPPSRSLCGAAVMLRGKNFEVTDCDIYASNYALRIFHAKVGVIARNRFLYGGRGYSIENTDRLIFEDNLVRGNNLTAIGNDVTTFWSNYCRNIYYAGNHIEQMYGADREMMTLDAGGGAYFGRIARVEGTHVTLAGDPIYKDYAPKPHTDWTGAAFMILDGTGAGQYRRVTKNDGHEWEVDRPWDIAPDATSMISIAPHRGRNLFIGNTFTDGGAFQLYGAALDTIVARNTGIRMDGFFAWGLNPHGWGWQPCWFCQFLDNEIREGNGYGPRSASIGVFTTDNNDLYSGPLARCVIFRRNVCDNNARFRIAGTTDDAIIEHCTVRDADQGIEVRSPAKNVLLRDNTFTNVASPLTGDGLPAAHVVAP